MTADELELGDVRYAPSLTENPFWDIVRVLPGDDMGERFAQLYGRHWMPDGSGIEWEGRGVDLVGTPKLSSKPGRAQLAQQYSWAIPDPAALAFVARNAKGGLVEVGAGTGYWAWQLSQLGVDVVALEPFPPHRGKNWYHSPNHGQSGIPGPEYFPLQDRMATDVGPFSDRTLFLCWPPYNDVTAMLALANYTGDRLIYIGEGNGGCTGDDNFHERLARDWRELDDGRITQWWGLHDHIWIYERKEKA